jgi:hypothetical protein
MLYRPGLPKAEWKLWIIVGADGRALVDAEDPIESSRNGPFSATSLEPDMLWADQWRALCRWGDRRPWWQQVILLPLLTPLLLPIAVACACPLCPRAAIFAAATLIAVYAPLISWGVVSWAGFLEVLGRLYLCMVEVVFFSVLWAWFQREVERWRGKKGKPPVRTSVSGCLWDREIDE